MALIHALRDGRVPPPTTVAEAPADPATDVGFVRSNLGCGALLVRAEAGAMYRLSWGEAEKPVGEETTRPLPPGRYQLTGYRRIRDSGDGSRWFLSVTGPSLRSFQVVAGETVEIAVPEGTSLMLKSGVRDGKLRVHMGFQGMQHAGATLYRDGVRIPVTYEVLSQVGRKLADGKIEYG